MHAPPLGSINTSWAHLLSLLKTLVKRTEREKKNNPRCRAMPHGMRLGSQSLPHAENSLRVKYISLGARGKGMVIYQLLRGVSTKQGRGEAGPGGTGRDPSAAQTAELEAKTFTEAINPRVPRPGRPISWDQARISSPASHSADAKAQLNYDAEQHRGKGLCLLK